jgi:hypothetical protein
MASSRSLFVEIKEFSAMANDLMNGNLWTLICDQTRSHAIAMARLCSPIAGHLMADIAHRFCDRPAPDAVQEFVLRQQQAIGANSLIGDMAYADAMARIAPKATEEIVEEMKKHAGTDFLSSGRTDAVLKSGIDFVSRIGTICFKDAMQRMTTQAAG